VQLLPIFNTAVAEQLPTATFFPLLSKEQCEQLVATYSTTPADPARVAGERLDKSKRSATVHTVPHGEDSKWLYELVSSRVAGYNQFGYEFDVAGIYQDFQLLRYEEGDHYDWHLDIGPGIAAHRKLSVVIQLSDPSEYEGGSLIVNAGTERECPKDQGQIIVFPSYILHKVTPVTKGTRWSLVCWVLGNKRFR
jgi:PKHD-type hydroxylase